MTKIKVLKIKILTNIIKKLEPSEAEYINYEKDIRQSKLDVPRGYNAAIGYIVLARALARALDNFIVFMIRALVIMAVISIITISYN